VDDFLNGQQPEAGCRDGVELGEPFQAKRGVSDDAEAAATFLSSSHDRDRL